MRSLRWKPSPVNSTLQVDVPCTVGDCFFACVSVWLNVYFKRTLFDPFKLRMCLAAALAWPDAACGLDRVRDDLHNFNGLKEDASLAEMQQLVLCSSTWADHPIMSVMALFCSKLIGCSTGFVVVQTEASGCNTQVLCVKPPVPDGRTEENLELACVLHLVRREHYLLLVDRVSHAMIFEVALQKWQGVELSESYTDSEEADIGDETNHQAISSNDVEEWTLCYRL